jgi:hypothetical protein
VTLETGVPPPPKASTEIRSIHCIILFRYRTGPGVVNFFQSGTGLTGCRIVQYSDIQYCGAVAHIYDPKIRIKISMALGTIAVRLREQLIPAPATTITTNHNVSDHVLSWHLYSLLSVGQSRTNWRLESFWCCQSRIMSTKRLLWKNAGTCAKHQSHSCLLFMSNSLPFGCIFPSL